MTMDDLNNLSLDNLGSWPWPVKTAVIVVICGVLGFAGWKYDFSDQGVQLEKLRKEELTKKTNFELKQKEASLLEPLKLQLKDIEGLFDDMKRRLPNRTEVASLLVDISQQGLGAGLEFELFKPGGESTQEFYAELPIEIKVIGTYHEFGTFISGISDLPRIVTSHNIKITPNRIGKGKKNVKGPVILTMTAQAKTYRYIDDSDDE